jgi:4-hydroxybenzoate polyprenyltransferase
MTVLQVSIGALNDVVDAPNDAGHKPGKPIPAGLVSPGIAWLVVAVGAGAGLGLAVPSGIGTVLLALVVLGIGFGYDLRLKGTAWSWLPFAVGVPLLPVFGWLGAAGALPGSFAVLVPVAVVAGAALAIANARADVERDAAAGIDSVAVRLGLRRAWTLNAGLLAVVVAAAAVTLLAGSAPAVAVAGVIVAAAVIAFAVVIGRVGDSARRERAWELEAIGVAVLAAAWLAGTPLGGP